MTSRELRNQRRAAERKAAKLQKKQRAAALSPNFVPKLADLAHPDDDHEPAPAPRPDISRADINRADINRANAQHSTGPRTQAGRLASSRNSLKHGLASGEIIIPGEDRAAFEELLAALREEHQPANLTEDLLIKDLAQSHWLVQRALRLQNDCFSSAVDANTAVDDKRLALYLRYQSTHQRAFHQALAALLRLQKERRKAGASQNGFVSQDGDPPDSSIGFVSQNSAAAAGFVPQTPASDLNSQNSEESNTCQAA